MKVAIYCRVSSQGQSLENQRARLKDFANERAWEYDIYSETGSTTGTRPVKALLLSELRAGKYQAVVVFKIDRWARSSTELILEIRELIDRDIQFISVSDSLDFSTPAGKLQFHILSVFAEFEKGLISERTKKGIRRAKLEGKYVGRPRGSKDKKRRKRSGYLLREAKARQKKDQDQGNYQDIEEYC